MSQEAGKRLEPARRRWIILAHLLQRWQAGMTRGNAGESDGVAKKLDRTQKFTPEASFSVPARYGRRS